MNRIPGLYLTGLLLFTALSVCASTYPLENNRPFVLSANINNEDVLLSGEVIPLKYEITITPNLLDWTFEGHVIIQVQAKAQNLRGIVLHANDLTIESIKVYLIENTLIDLHEGEEYSYENATDKLAIPTNAILELDMIYSVDIVYIGQMRDDMRGFYRSTYMQNGVEKRLGATQFQQPSARRAFPCFDSPNFKAVFDMKFLRSAQYQTISNTPLRETVPMENGLFMDIYEPTPVMSSYLVAFIIAESDYVKSGDEKFGIWSRPQMEAQTQYALEVGQELLESFSKFTAIDYYDSMKKIDMAAIPDFSASAMENWGLLTYRESNLLYSPEKSSLLHKKRIATVIAHEQAHMWFGDLVTCERWDYVWLNEGFAVYHQYFTTSKIEMNWELDHQFVVDQMHEVFQLDSSNTTYEMNYDVTSQPSPGSIGDIWYNKAASVIRMIEHLMTATKFRAGVQKYLRDNAFSNVTPSKLYAALQSQAPPEMDIASIMGSWANQRGYPVLTVEMSEDRSSAKLSQRRLLTSNPNHKDTTLYQIPVTYFTPTKWFTDTTHSILLTTKDAELQIPDGDSWVIFNTQQVGYYRVNYDKKSWDHILKALLWDEHDSIHVLNRAQIVDDVLNLARGDLLDYQLTFDILDYLDRETKYIPWMAAVNGLEYLSRRMAGVHSELFGEYVLKRFQNVYQYLGFSPETSGRPTEIFTRALVLQWLCKYNHEECVTKATDEFQRARQDQGYSVPVDIRQVVYCIGARHGDQEAYSWLWNKYLNEEMATEQVLLLNAMGCVVDELDLTTHLRNIFSGAVRKHDKSSAFSATYAYHDENLDKILSYLMTNHASVVDDLGSYGSLASYISGFVGRFTRQDQILALTSFADQNKELFGSSDATLRSAIEAAEYELYWDSQHLPIISAVIDKKVNGGASGLIAFNVIIICLGVIANLVFV